MTDKELFYQLDGELYKVPESRRKEFESKAPSASLMLTYKGENYNVPLNELDEFVELAGGADGLTYSSYDKDKKYSSSASTSPFSYITEPETELDIAKPNESKGGNKKGFWQWAGEAALRAQTDALGMPYEEPKGIEEDDDNEPSWGETLVKGVGSSVVGAAGGLFDKMLQGASGFQYYHPLTNQTVKAEDFYDKEMQNPNSDIAKASKAIRGTAERLSREADPTGGEVGFVDLIKEGKFGTFMQKGLATMAESSVQTLSAYSPYLATLNFLSMWGRNYAEQLEENPDIPRWKRNAYAIGNAAIEQAVEKFSDPVFKYIGGGKATREMTEELAKEIIEKATKEGTQTLKKRILRVLANTGKDMLGEGAEEIITSAGNDILGITLDAISKDKDYGIQAQWEDYKKANPDATKEDFAISKSKEYIDSFIGGAISAGYMSGAAQTYNETRRARSYDNVQQSREFGSTLDLNNSYDVNDKVKEVTNAAIEVFNEEGKPVLSEEFFSGLTSEEAFALSESDDITPEQKVALENIANAKAVEEGLEEKLDNRINEKINSLTAIANDASENGTIIIANHNGRAVFVKGAKVNNNGTVSLPDGNEGPVIVIDETTGEKTTVSSNEIQNATSMNTEEYNTNMANAWRMYDKNVRDVARTTMSPIAKLKAVMPFAGKKILIDLGNGPVEVYVQQITENGEVTIKGKKGDLGGQSIITINSGAFYDSIHRDADGNPVITEVREGEVAEEADEQPETAGATPTDQQDYREQTVTISINGNPVDVYVTGQDNTADRITYEYTDENGNTRSGSASIAEFEASITTPVETEPVVEPETPTEEPVAETTPEAPAEVPVTPETINWDALLENDSEAYFAEMQKRFGEKTANRINAVVTVLQKEIDSLNKANPKTQEEIFENEDRKEALQAKIDSLNGMIERLNAPAQTAPEVTTEPVAESPVDEAPVSEEEPVVETPVSEEPAPVASTPIEEVTPSGYIIRDGKIINPTVIEQPDIEGVKNKIFIAEKDGKWGYSFHAIMDNGNESGSSKSPIQLELLRYDSKEDAIKGALSYLETYKDIQKGSGSTALDSFIEYVRNTYLTPSEANQTTPATIEDIVAEALKREESLRNQLERKEIDKNQRRDMAYNAGKAIADMFATREDYEAYEEVASDLGEFNDDFERGVNDSFANRNQTSSTGDSDGNSVPLETEPNAEQNGDKAQGEDTIRQGDDAAGRGSDDGGTETADTGNKETEQELGKGESETAEEVKKEYPARKGNATRKLLEDVFGFAKVSIPNSESKVLNTVYDFMMEMAKMLGISPKVIGNGGWLDVANLRSTANADAAYSWKNRPDGSVVEPKLKLKYGRISSIAHEWWHSLDHVLKYFNTGKGRQTATYNIGALDAFNVRKETKEALAAVLKAMKDSGFESRIASMSLPLRYKFYLLENEEMTARAFDAYINGKFADAGIEVENAVYERTPYQPTPEEMEIIAPAFDNLFKVLKEKEGVKAGTSVLYHISKEIDENIEVKRELGELVSEWIQMGGNVVTMDSSAMEKALESEGIIQNAKRRRRSLFNKDLTPAEKAAIQKYILSLPENHAQSMPYTFEYRGKVYVFNTSRRFYAENTTQNPIGDGFEILHRIKLRELSDAEKALINRYTNDRNSQNLARLLQLLESKQTRGNLGSSNTKYSRTETGNDGLDASEHRVESSTSGRDNSGRRDSKESRALETRDGVIYGFVKDGVIYLEPSLLNPNTAIHEYTHLWDNVLMQLNRPLWERGKALMKQLPLWNEVVNDPNYSDIKDNEDLVASEVHSRLVGKSGEAILNQLEQEARSESITKSAKKLNLLGRIREWLNETTQWLKDAFKSWTDADLDALTLDDFVNLTMRDLVNFTNLSKKTKIKTKEEVREEKLSIKERAIADGTFMKAPNGKPTKLSEDQWLTVRTESFIDWFGDWINDPDNASKIVDENGEPMVVYHGSPYGNITEFNRKGHSVSGLREFGTYFGSNRKLAELYAYARQQAKGDIEKYELEKAKIDAIIFDPETPPRVALDAFDELDKLNESQKPKVYEVFLNIRNPKEFDAERSDGYRGWHKLKQDVGYDIKTGVEAVEAVAGHNSAARMSEKYDGIIAHNMADVHHEEGLDELMGDVFLVFDETPSNIKSANGNTSFDSESPNIYFHIERGSDEVESTKYNTTIDPDTVAQETAKQTYDRVVKDRWQEFQRQFQDAYQPVRVAIDAIQQETGNIPIEEYENYLLIQNQASSRSRVEIDTFSRRFYSPIIDQTNKIISQILESRNLDVNDKNNRAEVYKEILHYLIAKHGLERNEYYQTHKKRPMSAAEQKPFLDEVKREYDEKVNQINSDTTLTEAERQLQLRDAADEYNALVTEIKTREVPDMRDYSGLTALYGLDSKDFQIAEEQARQEIDRFESLVDTHDLWSKINAATNRTLRHSYESGLLSRSQYEDISSMFEFYIPLRGFKEDTAEDVYAYARFEGNRFNPAVQTAKGRTSLADDPIAIIMNMAESEIAQGNKNRAKQALYYYLLNRHVTDAEGKQLQNSLMQIEDVWYVVATDENGNEIHQIATPDHEHGETYEEFENRMQALAADGRAYKSKKGGVNVGMRFQKQYNKNAHYVYLKINGVDKAIYINGDPKAADAINGTYQQRRHYGEEQMAAVNRFLSSMFTNYSLEFTARNYFRDMVYSHINVDVRESDPAYRKKFRQNWRHNNMRAVMSMLKAYRAGEFDGRPLTEDEAAFVEFMENGGQTGYTVINSVENHKKELERAIKRMQEGVQKGGIKDSTIFKATLGGIELLNEVSELVTRFAAFKTSRDMGRGVVKSISDAKEITVNFNTKGAQDGTGWMGAVAKYFGWSKFFFNASVQGVQNITAMAKANKLKFCATVGSVVATGFLMPVIISSIAGLLGGDDDEEAYWNIPEYERHNNFCVPIGGGKYVKIPLPIGFREMYAIGDMVAAMAFDKKFSRDVQQTGMDIANKIASIVLPINPLESTANGLNIWASIGTILAPSSAQFLIQNATNTDWKGTPIQKEYTYNENDPQWMKAYASNPLWMKSLSKWCNETIGTGDMKGIDWSPEKFDNTLSNLLGGVYTLIKKSGRTISMIWNEENRNISNVPLAAVAIGSGIDNDDRFVTDAYFDMQDYYKERLSFVNRRAKMFGYDLDDVFLKKKGAHHPKMQEVYGSKEFDFMQEWYKGNKELEEYHKKVKYLEKKIAEKQNPSEALLQKLAKAKVKLEDERREFVDDMLELD